MALNFTVIKDILKEKTSDGSMKFSQGRVYLFTSVILYYATIGLLTFKTVRGKLDISSADIKQIIDAVQWAMALFAGYVFGGKGLDTAKMIFAKTMPSALAPDVSVPVNVPGVPPAPGNGAPIL
jgi:hypothetical protein